MGRKRIPGLYKRQGVWHVDKVVFGRRLCESTGTGDAEEAERFLARVTEVVRQQVVYGVRPDRTFREAATKYLNETCKPKKSSWLVEWSQPMIKRGGGSAVGRINLANARVRMARRRCPSVNCSAVLFSELKKPANWVSTA